jgi:hypothetical protein
MPVFQVVCRCCGQRWTEAAASVEILKGDLKKHRSCWKGRHPLEKSLLETVDIAILEGSGAPRAL